MRYFAISKIAGLYKVGDYEPGDIPKTMRVAQGLLGDNLLCVLGEPAAHLLMKRLMAQFLVADHMKVETAVTEPTVPVCKQCGKSEIIDLDATVAFDVGKLDWIIDSRSGNPYCTICGEHTEIEWVPIDTKVLTK